MSVIWIADEKKIELSLVLTEKYELIKLRFLLSQEFGL